MTENLSPTTVVPSDAGQANLELASALHDAAHWLEMHAADVPKLNAFIYAPDFRFGDEATARARAELAAVAAALGHRAIEQQSGGNVRIEGKFGRVTVFAEARVSDLLDEPTPPAPPYRPIIPVTDAEEEAWGERSNA